MRFKIYLDDELVDKLVEMAPEEITGRIAEVNKQTIRDLVARLKTDDKSYKRFRDMDNYVMRVNDQFYDTEGWNCGICIKNTVREGDPLGHHPGDKNYSFREITNLPFSLTIKEGKKTTVSVKMDSLPFIASVRQICDYCKQIGYIYKE